MNPVEEYIQSCEENAQEVLFTLHDIFTQDFGLTPKIKFRIPFYYGNTWVLYVNQPKRGGIEICYLNARRFEYQSRILDFRDRKQVGGITVFKLEDMPLEEIIHVTKAAVDFDKTIAK